MQDRVFTSLNAPRKWLGADRRLIWACGGVWGILTVLLGGIWLSFFIAAPLWCVGAVLNQRDPRFFDFLPLLFQLKSRYEAGHRER